MKADASNAAIAKTLKKVCAQIDGLRSEMRREFGEVRAEIGGVRAEIGGVRAEMKAGFEQVEAHLVQHDLAFEEVGGVVADIDDRMLRFDSFMDRHSSSERTYNA